MTFKLFFKCLDFYTNPEQFIPERFDRENGGVKSFEDRGILAPFSDGPRICLVNIRIIFTLIMIFEYS